MARSSLPREATTQVAPELRVVIPTNPKPVGIANGDCFDLRRKPAVERHQQTSLRATVARVPYVQGK
jgi:hypothetical protein